MSKGQLHSRPHKLVHDCHYYSPAHDRTCQSRLSLSNLNPQPDQVVFLFLYYCCDLSFNLIFFLPTSNHLHSSSVTSYTLLLHNSSHSFYKSSRYCPFGNIEFFQAYRFCESSLHFNFILEVRDHCLQDWLCRSRGDLATTRILVDNLTVFLPNLVHLLKHHID